jgi:transcriptional regulator with XRE-family HTH domain
MGRTIVGMGIDMLLTSADTIGGRIGQARRFTGLKQRELASQIGVSLRTYQNWERDDHEPTVSGLRSIAKQTGFPLLWLIEGDDEKDDQLTAGYVGDAQPEQMAFALAS